MKHLAITVLYCLLGTASFATNKAESPATIESLSWLGGQWVEQRGAGNATREQWSGPFGGTMLGFGITTSRNGTTSYEFFSIASTPNGLSYFARQGNAAPTEFHAIEITASRVVFENKTHDYPQRIIYQRRGKSSLDAHIEGTLNGKYLGRDWHYSRDEQLALFGPTI
jgi:hypothetical protein